MKKSIIHIYKHIFWVLAAVFAAFLCIQDTSAVKADVTIGWNTSATVGNTKIRIKSMNNDSSSKPEITKNRNMVSNIVYSINSYNVNTEKSTKIAFEENFSMLARSGDYIYGGINECEGNFDFFVLNAKTKKKKNMNICVGDIKVAKKRVLAMPNQGAFGNVPIYTFKLDGSDLIKIAEGESAVIKHGVIYYAVCDEKKWESVKVYKCNVRGKKKKAVTGWITRDEAFDKYLYEAAD